MQDTWCDKKENGRICKRNGLLIMQKYKGLNINVSNISLFDRDSKLSEIKD